MKRKTPLKSRVTNQKWIVAGILLLASATVTVVALSSQAKLESDKLYASIESAADAVPLVGQNREDYYNIVRRGITTRINSLQENIDILQDVQSRIGNGTVVDTPQVVITTDNTFATSTGIQYRGRAIYGYIKGGNPANTWGCSQLSTVASNTGCEAGIGWNKLAATSSDVWQKNVSRARLERTTGVIVNLGTYNFYARDTQTGTISTPTPLIVTCLGVAPTGAGVIASTSLVGMVGSDTWAFVENTKGLSTELGQSCQWTCAPGFKKSENTCITNDTNPVTFYTKSDLTTVVDSYNRGEKLYGYITNATPSDTYSCIDTPTSNRCGANGDGWAKLGTTGSNKDWIYNADKKIFELKAGLYLDPSWPTGTYKGYSRSGANGTISGPTPFILKDASSENSCKWVANGASFGGCPTFIPSEHECIKDGTEYSCAGRVTQICKCTVTSPINPVTFYTKSDLTTVVDSYNRGEKLYGYITNATPSDTYSCIDTPTSNRCGANGDGWAKLGTTGSNKDWIYNADKKIFELKAGLYLDPSWPTGTYKGYSRSGANGTISGPTSIMLKDNVPTKVYTKIDLKTIVSSYNRGETLYGYTTGTSPTDTWECIDLPGNNNCKSGTGWRKLGASQDDWYYYAETGRFELRKGLYLDPSWPSGTYTIYLRNGQNGAISGPTPLVLNEKVEPQITTYTKSDISTIVDSYNKGEKLYGYILNTNPIDTWACIDVPNSNSCPNGTTGWRKLGASQDDWYYYADKGRFELRKELYLDPTWPSGKYKMYTRNGQNGTISNPSPFTLNDSPSGSSCKWLAHAIFGGCGNPSPDPKTVACTQSIAGEVSYCGNQKSATCTCTAPQGNGQQR